MSIQEITQTIESLISTVRKPLTNIPTILLAASTVQMPGLSSITIASNIIRRQGEAGAPMGSAADGSQNIAEAMEVIRVEEMIKGLKTMARVDSAIPIGTVQVAGTVQTAAGPGTFTGTNVNNVPLYGIIR